MSDPTGRIEAVFTKVGMPRPIRQGLLDSHRALRSAHRASLWTRAAQQAGDFAQWAYLALEWATTRRFEEREPVPPDFPQRIARMRPTKALPASELARLGGTITTVHSLAVPRAAPPRLDAAYLAQASSWVLGELVVLLGEGQPGAVEAAEELAAVPRPTTWEREGQALLRLPLNLDERILAVLYWRHRATVTEMQALLPSATALAIAGAAARRPEIYYRKTDQSMELTAGGTAWVEAHLLPRLKQAGRQGGRQGQRRGRGPRGPPPQGRPGPPPARQGPPRVPPQGPAQAPPQPSPPPKRDGPPGSEPQAG